MSAVQPRIWSSTGKAWPSLTHHCQFFDCCACVAVAASNKAVAAAARLCHRTNFMIPPVAERWERLARSVELPRGQQEAGLVVPGRRHDRRGRLGAALSRRRARGRSGARGGGRGCSGGGSSALSLLVFALLRRLCL